MAAPRVFVSSTCYDLAEERDAIVGFCNAFGFDTALSERGDVFYHPDLHTHTACIRETSNCQIFILVIGGRFGGKHVIDKTKSITNAEYIAAKEQGIPIFTFIKQDVLNDHNIWQKNRDKPFVKDINYPSIDKQENAADIFNFIDQVRLAPNNNGFFGFRLTKEIFDYLRKQWAGMFFEYLQSRSLNKQLSTTNETLATLTAASEKIEEIVKGIYKNMDGAGAEAALNTIDLEGEARELFATIATRSSDRHFLYSSEIDDAVNIPPPAWHDFFVQFGFFEIVEGKEDDEAPYFTLVYLSETIAKLSGKLTKLQRAELTWLQEQYDAYLKLPSTSRKKLIENHAYMSISQP
ncbi:DUF4062 domain-containing protein [Pseudomonas sp. GM60]|uniref:DUF4062 domain-containing protein n=1 Tax=Pseudomonas sp. GM60 TaxID=1144334 RepID=UPI0002709DBE|nr:DUF4062 domain-containing protein [Pseudomonas sp. GM60]EJM86381.1 hypothetical protein PMI32_00839 [Pseudomonas sp. GM60]